NATANTEAKVTSLQIAETVETSGELKSQPFASLNWKTGGIVETVNVQPGDFVKAGDVLLTLQPESTSASLAASQADLETAQSNLQALISPDGSSVGAAIQNTAGAFDAWNDARADFMDTASYHKGGGNDDLYSDLAAACDALINALEEYPLAADTDAQFYYWASRAESLGYVGEYEYAALTPTLRSKLSEADASLVDEILNTQSEFDSLAKSFAMSMTDQDDAIDLMKAYGAYEQSSDALLDAIEEEYGVLVQPSESDLISAQANVDAAQASVNSLRIVAPFDGQVLSVENRVGDTVSAGELSANLADMGNLYVEAEVDESDVANVKVGNQAEVTLDAVPHLTLKGSVTSVNPVGEIAGGLVKYTVRIKLNSVEDTFLPLGSTANVVILVQEAQSTLAVPIVAIQNDSKGEYVWVLRNSKATRVDVIGGAIVGDHVAVTGDLSEGEILQIVPRESGFTPPNPFSGGDE
ncbi:MAG: efflux RND transporter periplasmic adaptor subunit, partial [Chloroflexi bacterium]|nr:efflux RND transporter periplasmic adaptor subunit [Chloroflexota bacterium]